MSDARGIGTECRRDTLREALGNEAQTLEHPPARDEGEYARARAHVAAGRTLDLLRWQPPALLERDRDWAPGLTARQAGLWHLERFLAVAEGGAPTFAPIAATLEGIHRRLAAGWSAERERGLVWPAFGDDRL